MSMEFRVLIREGLLKTGLSNASEISESMHPSCFGNSESVWVLGNIRIRFIKDRGQLFVDIGSIFDESRLFIFDDVALFMEWQKLDEIIKADQPLDLQVSLNFIKRDLRTLENIFSKKELKATTKKLDEISKKKAQARFG